jgi:hypothetical protein
MYGPAKEIPWFDRLHGVEICSVGQMEKHLFELAKAHVPRRGIPVRVTAPGMDMHDVYKCNLSCEAKLRITSSLRDTSIH